MPISRVASATGVNTVSMPAHEVGDLIVMWGFNDIAGTTSPNTPSGFTAAVTAARAKLAWRVATATNTTVGTVGNCTSLIVTVYRGARVGAATTTNASSTTINYPAVGVTFTDGSSWVINCAGHRSTDTAITTAPSGQTLVNSVSDTVDQAVVFDSNGGRTTNWPLTSAAVGGTSSNWTSVSMELQDANYMRATMPMVFTPSLTVPIRRNGSGTASMSFTPLARLTDGVPPAGETRVTFVGAGTAVGAQNQSSGSHTLTVSLPTGWQPDDVAILMASITNGTVTHGSWTPLSVPAQNSSRTTLLYRRLQAGDPDTWSFTTSPGFFGYTNLQIFAYRGVRFYGDPFDKMEFWNPASSGTVTRPNITNIQKYSMGVMMMTVNNQQGWSTPAGWDKRAAFSGGGSPVFAVDISDIYMPEVTTYTGGVSNLTYNWGGSQPTTTFIMMPQYQDPPVQPEPGVTYPVSVIAYGSMNSVVARNMQGMRRATSLYAISTNRDVTANRRALPASINQLIKANNTSKNTAVMGVGDDSKQTAGSKTSSAGNSVSNSKQFNGTRTGFAANVVNVVKTWFATRVASALGEASSIIGRNASVVYQTVAAVASNAASKIMRVNASRTAAPGSAASTVRGVYRKLVGGATSSATLMAQRLATVVYRTVTATGAHVGAVARRTTRSVSAVGGSVLNAFKLTRTSKSSSATGVGIQIKQTQKTQLGVAANSAANSKHSNATRRATAGHTGALTALKVFLRTLTATAANTSTALKSVTHTVSSSVGNATRAIKQVNISERVTMAAVAAMFKLMSTVDRAVSTSVAAYSISKVFLRTVTAVSTSVANTAILRAYIRTVMAIADVDAALIKMAGAVRRAGTSSVSRVSKAVTGALRAVTGSVADAFKALTYSLASAIVDAIINFSKQTKSSVRADSQHVESALKQVETTTSVANDSVSSTAKHADRSVRATGSSLARARKAVETAMYVVSETVGRFNRRVRSLITRAFRRKVDEHTVTDMGGNVLRLGKTTTRDRQQLVFTTRIRLNAEKLFRKLLRKD